MSATWCHLNSPLSPRKITSCTRIARSPASGVNAIATSSLASAPHARDRYDPSDHVLFLTGHMMSSLDRHSSSLAAPAPLAYPAAASAGGRDYFVSKRRGSWEECAMATVTAEPYEFEFHPETTALLMIDFQRDF